MATSTSTIVFIDVVSSTSRRAALGEDPADRVLRSLERTVGEVVAAHFGRVVKTGRDGVVAAFESATDAVQACVAVQQSVASAFDDVRLRVGAAAGDVSWDSGDCFGMPVLVARRLQRRAEGGQILVSAVVRWLAGDRSGATFTSVGALELAGIQGAVEAFEISWLADGDTETVVLAIPLPPAMGVVPTFPLVGRHREMAALSAAAADASGGRRRTVLVGGEAGAGKTRVAFELARERHAAGAIVLLGTCDAELGMPYQPWVQILSQLVRALPDNAAASLAPHLAQLSVLLPEIERLAPGIERPASADPETERYRLFQAVDALLAWAASDRDMVVVVDDLHWAGAQTLALLRHVARGTEAARMVVVGTFRDTGDEVTDPLASCLADLRRVDAVARIQLGALDLPAVEQFVSEAAGRHLDSRLRTVAELLAERSGGNAFYLGELWRHLVGRERGDGSDASRVPSGLAGVPESVREVVTARLARLSDVAREMVELIATAGLRIDVRVLRTAFVGVDIGAALDELVRARLLVEVTGPPVVYHFAHALVRDTIVQRASSAGRAPRHRRLAEAIERVYEADRRPVLAELARHYVEAAALGDTERAVYYARRAATQAMRSHAYEEAIVHLEAAQALSPPGSPEHVQVRLDLGTCHTRSGFDPRAITLFETAFEAARDLGLVRETVSAVLGLSRARALRGLPGAVSLDMVTEALRLLGDDDPVLRIRLRAAQAEALSLAGRPHEAVELARQVLEEARLNGEPVAILAALNGVIVGTTEPARWLGPAVEGARIAEELGDLWDYCSFTAGAVGSYIELGALDEARQQHEHVRSASERGRFDMWRYQVANLDSLLAVADGHFDDAERHATLATSLLPATTEFVAGVYGMQMYAVRREQGRLGEVLPILTLASGIGQAEAFWRPGLAALYADVGMLEDAGREFEQLARGGFASVPRDANWPTALTFLAEVCIALHDRAHALQLYDALEPHANQTIGSWSVVCFGPADRLRGGLAALAGRRKDARAHFEAALALAERSGSPVWLAHVQHDWALALGERTDLLEQARATAARLAMRDLEARCQSALTAREPAPRPSPVALLPDGLSTREVEVLRLVATGRSNRDIGTALFISSNTVANHVRSILQKTASANRAEATAYAARKGLLP